MQVSRRPHIHFPVEADVPLSSKGDRPLTSGSGQSRRFERALVTSGVHPESGHSLALQYLTLKPISER
jgi:hypothetical protein